MWERASEEAEESFSEGFESDAEEPGEAPGLWQQLCTLQHGLSEVERKISKHSSLQEARQQRCTRNRHRWVLQQRLEVTARFKSLLPPGVSLVSPAAQEAPEAPPQGPAPRPQRKKPLPRRQASELLPREPFCLEHEVSKEPRPVARVSRRPEASRESALERNVVALDPVDLVDLTQGLGNSFAPSVSSGRGEQEAELHVSHETFHPSHPSRELQVQEDVDHSASLGTDAPPVVPTNTFPAIDPAIVEHTSTSPGIVQDPAAAPVSGSAPAAVQDPAAQGVRSMSSAGDEDLPERPEPSMALEPEDVRDILEQLQEESSEAEEESEEAEEESQSDDVIVA